ncbi:MAG: hypothetical protein HZC41_02660 [Chloroflexi bacterium]|nr:hypothetical protein [Chloroflexota bacterium]
MDNQTLQNVAGSISSLLFITANLPMLVKAYRTRNLRSYSLTNMVLINVGNLLYWLYIAHFPPGPIWLLHSFYTVTSAVMLVWYLRYERCRRIAS